MQSIKLSQYCTGSIRYRVIKVFFLAVSVVFFQVFMHLGISGSFPAPPLDKNATLGFPFSTFLSFKTAKAAPMAAPRNGAEQGVATIVARTPLKKDPCKPCLLWRFPPTPVALVPISNTPNIFNAKMNMSNKIVRTT